MHSSVGRNWMLGTQFFKKSGSRDIFGAFPKLLIINRDPYCNSTFGIKMYCRCVHACGSEAID